ncbi:Hypothetical Protein FCC1311_100182 [Hondaea fermentalgiana]|uniref:Uncharacterized protein n=1 Tax=Hondaea fermentalgiana TaxID=2315210 RepID=A0A2R5GT85_9STRA|nr:Hypothetical Protein FCC1311_100182 [Hondaea fermentalgiana]|eukprot:GBG33795.1 Hypothetical Protein FCC1311_100182 [Hondaea fermentalgiana]
MMQNSMRMAAARVSGRRMMSEVPHLKFPAGQSEGGHARFVVNQPTAIREKMMFFKAPEVWPLVAAVSFAVCIGTWKTAHMDMKPSAGPWKTFFGANNREVLGITPSDAKLEYKKE